MKYWFGPLVLIMSLACLVVIGMAVGFVINTSDSMPLGLYYKSPAHMISVGDTVLICLDPKLSAIAISHHYIQGHGMCPDGAEPLVKSVIALPGMRVKLTPQEMIVGPIHYSAPRFVFNSKGKKIASIITPGTYNSKGLWVYGSGNSRYSWDSRYFGSIDYRNIKEVLRPLLIF